MKKKVLATLAIVAVLGLTACQKETNEAPEATPTVEAVKEQKLTNTPSLEPSVTLTPTPEPTSTPTPVPTSTPTPEPTSTPIPTVPPTVYAEGVNFVTGFKRADDDFAVSNGVFLVGDEGYFRAMNSEKEYIKKGTFFAYGTVENDCYFLAHGGEIEEGVFTAYEQAVLSDIQGNVLGTILHDSGLTVFAEEKIVYCDRFDDTVLNIFDLPTQEVTSVSIIDESTGAQYSVLSMSNFYDEKLYLAAANFDINKSVLAELSYDGSYNILPNFENTDIEYFSLDGDTHNDCAAFSGNSYDGSKIIGLTNVKNGSSILLRTEDLFNEEVYNY